MYDGAPILPAVYYGFRQPRSAILQTGCTREWFREQVRRGTLPRRSIWVPGPCAGGSANPEIGDVFAPDETWSGPFLLNAVPDDHMPWRPQ